MHLKIVFNLLLFISATSAIAQTDTVFHYYSREMKEVNKDSSYTYTKMYPQENEWRTIGYLTKNNMRKFEGQYQEEAAQTPVGLFKHYKDNGTFDYNVEYEEGKVKSKAYFYLNGSKKSLITYQGNDGSIQKGWDENGKELKSFVVEREARFKGGPQGWRKMLEKTLNANVAADAGAPAGQYTVKVQFIVDKEGYVSRVKAIEIPAACKPCASEAVNVISTGPQWEPAIQNNEPVLYQAIQYITFQVEETKGRKRG